MKTNCRINLHQFKQVNLRFLLGNSYWLRIHKCRAKVNQKSYKQTDISFSSVSKRSFYSIVKLYGFFIVRAKAKNGNNKKNT